MESELKLYKYKLNTSNNITDKDIFKCTKSVFDDLDFHNFLYYSSILRYKKLLGPTFKELREIIALEDEFNIEIEPEEIQLMKLGANKIKEIIQNK